MKTRKEVVKIIKEQLDSELYGNTPYSKYAKPREYYIGQHHYGLFELRKLMDFIYGETPKNKDEEL